MWTAAEAAAPLASAAGGCVGAQVRASDRALEPTGSTLPKVGPWQPRAASARIFRDEDDCQGHDEPGSGQHHSGRTAP